MAGMRLLKSFFITILGFFLVITLVSLLMPSKVITTRTVSINAKASDVMAQIQNLNNWPNWHPLFSDPQFKIMQTSDGKVATWSLNGETNKLHLISASHEQAVFHLISSGENTQENKISILQFKDSSAVQVEWSALTHLKWYPWEKFSGIFVDKITGAGYEAALHELKTYLEITKKED